MAASPGGPYFIDSRTGTHGSKHGSKHGSHRHKGAVGAPHHATHRKGATQHHGGHHHVHSSPHHLHAATASSHEPAIYRSHATLQAWDSTNYLATVQLTRSPATTIANVPVSAAIPSANMVVGKVVAVLFFDHHNSADAMVVGVGK